MKDYLSGNSSESKTCIDSVCVFVGWDVRVVESSSICVIHLFPCFCVMPRSRVDERTPKFRAFRTGKLILLFSLWSASVTGPEMKFKKFTESGMEI